MMNGRDFLDEQWMNKWMNEYEFFLSLEKSKSAYIEIIKKV